MPTQSNALYRYRYRPPVNWLRLLPTVAIAILSVIIASVLSNSSRAAMPNGTAAAAPIPVSPLRLRITSKPQQVEVYWDHAAKAIHEAERGTMRISDGDVSEVIPFDTRQLQDGSVVYRPRTNDVSVRLEVIGRDGQTVSESVRAVATP